MGDGLSTQLGQIAVEEESVEGTAETLVDADATQLAYEPSFSPNIERFIRNPNRATFSQIDAVMGKQAASIGWKAELKGSGSADVVPAWADSILGCGFVQATVVTINVGAITSGPFEPGETVVGGTSAATGRVVGEVKNGAAAVPMVVTSGTWQSSETITGGTSGASATTSATVAADKGFEYRPVSTGIPSETVGYFLDGTKYMIAGARGNLTIDLRAGEPGFLAFAYEGVYESVTDTALLSPTYESTIPLAFLNVGASIHDLSAIFTQLSIDMGNTIAERTSANAAKGILSFKITERDPSGSIDPEMELVADHDFYGRYISGATGRIYAELPSANAGEKITIAGPRVQYAGVSQSDRDQIAVASLDFELKTAGVTAGDDELQIGIL